MGFTSDAKHLDLDCLSGGHPRTCHVQHQASRTSKRLGSAGTWAGEAGLQAQFPETLKRAAGASSALKTPDSTVLCGSVKYIL